MESTNSPVAPEVVAPHTEPLSPLSPVSTRAAYLRKYKKLIYAALILLILIVITGLGVFAYFSNNPQKLLDTMTDRLLMVHSAEYAGQVDITYQQSQLGDSVEQTPTDSTESAAQSHATIQFSGTTDLTTPENPTGIINLTADSTMFSYLPTKTEVAARMLNKMIYVTTNQVADGQWIAIDTTEFTHQAGGTGPEAHQQAIETQQKIVSILKNAHILQITKKLPDEKIDDIANYHFRFSIDKTKLTQALYDIYLELLPANFSEEQRVKLRAYLDEKVATLAFAEGEIWVGKSDLLPHKLVLPVTVSNDYLGILTGEAAFSIELSNYNQPVKVEAPAESIHYQDVLSQVFTQNPVIFDQIQNFGWQSSKSPDEHINLGKDMVSRTDAEELLGAINRFKEIEHYVPWNTSGGISTQLAWTKIAPETQWTDGGNPNCSVLEKLTKATVPECFSADEVRISFMERLLSPGYNSLYLYNRGQSGDATYACFAPLSQTFRTQAAERCKDITGSGLPADIEPSLRAMICGGYRSSSPAPFFSCLPN